MRINNFKKLVCVFQVSFMIIFLISLSFIELSCSKKPKMIKVGVELPLTGDYATYGKMSQKGMIIAQEEWNAEKEFQVELIFEDDHSNINGALDAENKLINIDKVPIIIGGIASSIALAMAPRAEENKVVLMCAFASSPRLKNAGEYIFRIMPSDDLQAKMTARWFEELNLFKVAIIYQHNDWSAALKDAFKEDFNKLGSKVIFEEAVKEGQKDFRDIISKLKSVVPKLEIIYLISYPKEGGVLLKQLREFGIELPVFGADPWANKEIIGIAGKAAEGARFLAPLAYSGPEYQAFAESFSKKFKEKPDLTASAGYDSLKVVLHSIEEVIKTGKEITGENIKSSLYNIKDLKGATGITTFDKNRDVIGKEFAKYIIKNNYLIMEGSVK